jgi:amino acid transporter
VSEANTSVEAFGYRQELQRSLSLFDLLVYGLVFITPIGPFAVFGFVYNASKGMVPLVYFVGLVAMLFTAASYMAMSRAFPIAGSVYTYASRSIGETVGFFAGWAILLDYILTPTLVYVACSVAIHSVVPDVPKAVWVVVLLGFNTLVNLYGIETTSRVAVALLGLQLVVLAIFVAMATWAVMHGVNGAHLSLQPLYNAKDVSPSLIFSALSLAVLSFLGFDAVSTLAEEARGGPNVVGRATMASLCLAAFLFMVETYLASLFVLGHPRFAPGDASDTAIYIVVMKIGGFWLKILLSIFGVLVAGIPTALTAQAATARLLYGMGRDGMLPRALARVSPRKVPDNAIYLVAAVTLILGLLLVNRLELLSSMVSFGALLGFLLLHCSVIAHAVRQKKYRAWFQYLLLPSIGFLIIAYVLLNAQVNAKIAGGVWIITGAGVLVVLKLMGRSTALAVETSSDLLEP